MHCSEFRILESRVWSKYLVIPSRRRANWGEPPFQVERLAKIRCRAVPEKYMEYGVTRFVTGKLIFRYVSTWRRSSKIELNRGTT